MYSVETVRAGRFIPFQIICMSRARAPPDAGSLCLAMPCGWAHPAHVHHAERVHLNNSVVRN